MDNTYHGVERDGVIVTFKDSKCSMFFKNKDIATAYNKYNGLQQNVYIRLKRWNYERIYFNAYLEEVNEDGIRRRK